MTRPNQRPTPAILSVVFVVLCAAAATRAADIAERDIAALRQQLAEAADVESAAQLRRACKRIVRRATTLLDDHPDAPQRYRVMHVIFQTQQRLYRHTQSDENVRALVETSRALREAPDDQAEYRLDADVVLLQLEMSRTDSVEDQCIAIARLADRYRDTPAEAKSLMMSLSLAFDLGNRTLLDAFRQALTQRFGHDPQIRAFLRERFASRKPMQVVGIFKRADGERVSFPKGRPHVVCFWSRHAEDLDKKFAEVVELQRRVEGGVTVYSFNLDEMPDAGERLLRQRKLDWVPVHLPGGSDHPLYRALATQDGVTANVVVDPFGYGEYWGGGYGTTVSSLLSRYTRAQRDPRQMALWRSLLTGEYLVDGLLAPRAEALAKAERDAIRACFVPHPQRYRLTPQQELANFDRADQLCRQAIAGQATGPDPWPVRGCRAIALMGRWRMTGEAASLDEAAAIAEQLVAQPRPAAANLVARYVLAVAAMQRADAQPADIHAAFVEAVGGDDAPAIAHVAALMLALEGHLVVEYGEHRDQLLTRFADDPAASWFSALIFDRRMTSELFARALPQQGRTATAPPRAKRTFTAEFTTLDGKARSFPRADSERGAAVVFLEPPADAAAETQQDQVMAYLATAAAHHPMALLAVFRADDPAAVRQRMAAKKWAFDAVALPDEAWRRVCRQHGVVSADRVPNMFFLTPDGRVSVALTGLSLPGTVYMANLRRDVEPLLHEHEMRLAQAALAAGRYDLAAERLEAVIKLNYQQRQRYEPAWLIPNSHRRMLVWCDMQLGRWDRALAVINQSIDARFEHTSYIQNQVNHHKWCHLCHRHVFELAVRVRLLQALGRDDEAKRLEAMLTPRPCPLAPDLSTMWQAVDKALEGARARPLRYGSDERYLAGKDKAARNRQPVYIYEFDIQTDFMLRAKILEKLGRDKEAAQDRLDAKLHAWPYEPREYDITRTHLAAAARRADAARLLDRRQPQAAFDAVDANVRMHEAWALRADFLCRSCGDQVQALRLRGNALDKAGLKKEAELSWAMSQAATCPPDGKQRDSTWYFPAGRVGWGNVTPGDLAYIDAYLAGGVHANAHNRRRRFELAEDLDLRARALEQLGKADAAARDRQRARALVFRSGPSWQYRTNSGSAASKALPDRYVDLFGSE